MAVEEQLENDADDPIYGTAVPGPRYGQKLTISERIVTNLSLLLRKYGSPSGDLYLGIYKVSDDSLIIEKLWGTSKSVPETDTWIEVAFDNPVNINEEVRIVARVTFGNSTKHLKIRYKNSDVKANEMQTRWQSDFWNDIATRDTAYKYTYTLPGPTTGFNKIFYTSEPPTPSAWNQVKQETATGWKKLLYS